MKLPLEIFKQYDIRGHSDKILSADLNLFAKAIRTYIKNINSAFNSISIGYDARETSLEIYKNLTEALKSQGLNVFGLGFCTTAISIFSKHELRADMSIMITASHNPWHDNGFKIYLRRGRKSIPVCGEELQKIFKLQEISEMESAQDGEIMECKDIHGKYADFIGDLIDINKLNNFKIGWNINAGAAESIIDYIIKKIPGEHTIINNKEEIGPDPVNKLLMVKDQKNAENFDIFFSFDGDADRIVTYIKGEKITPAQAIYILLRNNKRKLKIVWDVHVDREILSFFTNLCFQNIVSKVGHSNIQKNMNKFNADIAAEISYHFFFKQFFTADDGFLFALKMIEKISELGLDFNVKNNKDVFNKQSNLIRHKCSNPSAILLKIKKFAKEKSLKTSSIDGIKIYFSSGWLLARKSNTENCLSIMYSADNSSAFLEIEKIIENLLQE